MKKGLIITFVLLFAVSGAYAYDFQEGAKNWAQWTACASDDDCVPIHDECGGWTAVNKQYQKEGEEYQNELGAAAKCLDVKMEPAPKALCLEQACAIKPTGLDLKEK